MRTLFDVRCRPDLIIVPNFGAQIQGLFRLMAMVKRCANYDGMRSKPSSVRYYVDLVVMIRELCIVTRHRTAGVLAMLRGRFCGLLLPQPRSEVNRKTIFVR